MATGEKLFRGIFSFISISITAILLNFPFVAAASTGLVNSNLDVSLSTGAATLSIPIEVPPGRNGMEPNLAFTYNSYRGNGWIGMGWDLDMGAIQRSTKFGVDYSARDFAIVRNGASNDLVARADWGQDYFGAKIEEAFSKYYLNPLTGGWEVTAKDGFTYFYGSTPRSRQDDPNNSSRVFKWCLDKVEDTNGNFMVVYYTKDQGEIYLKEIQYAGNGNLSPSIFVKFILEGRNDASPMFTANFEVVTAKKLTTIEVMESDGTRIRAYKLSYSDSESTFRLMLVNVQLMGSNAPTGSMLPVIELDWQKGLNNYNSGVWSGHGISDTGGNWADLNGDGKADYVTSSKYGHHYISLFTEKGYDNRAWSGHGISDTGGNWADLNGDGKADYVTSSRYGHHYVSLSTGSGYKNMVWSGHGISDTGGNWVDLNGDGKADYVTSSKYGHHYVSLSTGSGYKSMVWSGHGISDTGGNWADLNGDGKADYVTSSKYGHHYVSLSTGSGYKNMVWSGHGISDTGGNWADLNGDGKADYVTSSRYGHHYVSISTGNGYKNMVWSGHGISDTGGNWVDLNGDGKADYVTSSRYGHHYVSISTGNGYKNMVWSGHGISDTGGNWVDLNGNGKADYVTSSRYGHHYVSFVAGEFPDLVSYISNGFEATTTIRYTRSSNFQNYYLPVIVSPVSKISVNDGFDNLSTTEYAYSGGLYDLSSKEFRGFETVTQKTAVGTASEIWTETRFHQDPYFKGRQYRVDLKEPGNSGALLSQTTFSWSKSDFGPPGNKSAFVKLIEKRTESYDSETVTLQENYQYNDTNGNFLSTTASGPDAESVTTYFLYENFGDWLWRKTQETVEGSLSGKVRESYYDYEHDTGNLLYKEFWLDIGSNPRIEMTYDKYGNQETVTDARGNTTITEYDPATHTYPVKITYPQTNGVSHVVENEEWDYRFGKVLITEDENGNRTYYDYDDFGRLVQVDSPDGGQVVTEYYDDEFPRLVITRSLEDNSGSTIDNYQYFDGLGRQIQTIAFGEGGKAIVTQKYYDELGRNDLVEGPFFDSSRDYLSDPPTEEDYPINPPTEYPWTQTTFDKRGRPDTVENSDGEYGSVSTTFSYSGLSTTVSDPDGGSKTEKKDYLGRVVKVIEHADNANYDTNYVFNVAGDLLQVIDFYGNTTTINYDSLGRKLNMTDQDMGFWVYTYNANGNLQTQTDQKEQTVTFAYDELNRVTSKSYDTSDPTVNYSYDNLYIPNGRGRLFSVSNNQVTTTYNAYDPMGRAKSVSKTISGDGNAYTTQYIYDLSGKLKQTIYPDGYRVSNFFYPGTGLLEAVTGSDSVEYARNTNYEPTGKIGRIDHGNGTYTQHNYDPESTRLASIVSSRSGPTLDLQNKAYQYTKAGNIKQIADNIKDINYDYTYDKLHRLKTETNTGSYDLISYDYDPLGNILSKTVGSATMDYNYQGPRPHAVKTIKINGANYDYAYDDNGNMISGPDFTDPHQVAQRTISYNADNMPQSISHTKGGNTVTTNLVYDGNGTRARKQIPGGSTTYYIGDHYEVKDGVATKFIFAGNLRVAKITGSGINYFHKDHLGSSSVISDNNGNAIETSVYMPFGSLRDHSGSMASNYKFTDQEFDPSSALYNYNARLYDPIIGRFISPDPFVQAAFDPQTLNRYSYVRNNPLIYIDPSGYSFFSKAWKKIKKAAKKAAKAVVSAVTNEVLTYALFSIFDIAVPGLGQAISIGVGILSSYLADKAVNKISGTNQGGGGGSVIPASAGRRSPSGNPGGSYTGPLFPSGVSPGGGYAAISGTTHDFVNGYSANVVSNGHVFHGAFYEAIGKIYSGVSTAFVKGLKAGAYSLKRAFYSEWVNNSVLRTGTLWGFKSAGRITALNLSLVGLKAYAIFDVMTGGPFTTAAMVYAGTPQGQIMINEFVPSIFPSPPTPTFWGGLGYIVGGTLDLPQL